MKQGNHTSILYMRTNLFCVMLVIRTVSAQRTHKTSNKSQVIQIHLNIFFLRSLWHNLHKPKEEKKGYHRLRYHTDWTFH
jgi:hypothetical protein